jgi:hypothetical protein
VASPARVFDSKPEQRVDLGGIEFQRQPIFNVASALIALVLLAICVAF